MLLHFLLMTKAQPKVDVLAIHETVCEFTGVKHQPCMFRTALCPDRCGHARDTAIFKVLEYTNYEKKGEYGDDKQQTIYIDTKNNVFGQKPEILETLKHLEVGKKYRVVYHHLYVDDGEVAGPERPTIEITPIN